MEYWQMFKDWFWGLGDQYGVDPLVFGLIYVGAIPFFSASAGWLIRNARKGRPIILPALCAAFFFISAYLYLAAVGKNVPFWVYCALALLVLAGAYSAISKIRRGIKG